MGMRKTMIALLAASASISALANTNGSDIWQQYTPFMVTERPCCTIPKQDSSLSGADFAQLTCCRTGIPNPVILLIAFTHASASPTCAL